MTKLKSAEAPYATKTSTLIWITVSAYVIVFASIFFIWTLASSSNINTIYIAYGFALFVAGLPVGYAAARSSKGITLKVLGTIAVSLLLVIPLLITLFMVNWAWSLTSW